MMKREDMGSSLTEHTHERLTAGLRSLAPDGRFAIAFSGGLDSRFLAYFAKHMGLRPLLLHAEGPHIAARESRFAREWAEENGMEVLLLESDPLAVPQVAVNDRMRCYHCKRALFTTLLAAADGLPLCDGTQASDSDAYRPGVAALKELGIFSPLADAGLTKPEIRRQAFETGMSLPDQQARPCLLTRFAYFLVPGRAELTELDRAEERIEAILNDATLQTDGLDSFPDFRLRRVGADCQELHLTHLPGADETFGLPPALETVLEETVLEHTGKPLSAIRIMPNLSGFFDQGDI